MWLLFFLSSLALSVAEVPPIEVSLNQDTLHFLIAGDYGGWPPPFYTTPTQWRVAEKMGVVGEEKGSSFVLALGDNFYFLGVRDENDVRFQKTYEDVYNASSLFVPWYPTMGNHDWHGSGKAQLDYSHISSRWTYPWYWYTLDYTINTSSGKNVSTRIVMLDTTIECGINGEGTPIDETMASEQWTWLEKQLQGGKDADYLMVVGHYPLFASGITGPTNPCVHDRLKPLLDQYKVSAYLAGHEHNLQHLSEANNDNSVTEYFVVGCSNFVSPGFLNSNAPEFKVNFQWGEMEGLGGCFGRVEVTEKSMKMIFLQGRDGEEVYFHDVLPRKK